MKFAAMRPIERRDFACDTVHTVLAKGSLRL